jgi:TonB-linked outer membrane protein, SusC/RagA family
MRKKLRSTRIILLALLWIIPFWQVLAQDLQVQGKVTDASTGETLPGVSILVKGTNIGTTTNLNGAFSIKAPKGSTLVFSFIGYLSEEKTVENEQPINVALATDVRKLNEVVVIGYGSVKKSDATGSVVAVGASDFNKGAITSPQDLLVGKSAGVVITTSGGAPGSGSTIRIRGGSSLNASNDPLIIIDGVPLDNSTISGSNNFLSFINPNDIESFTVLKDASATAIYGSRASNGVILITTKKGKVGSRMQITYDGNSSVASPIKYVDVYSGDQLREIALEHQSLYTADAFNKFGSQNTNWQKEIFRTSISQDHNLSLSGAYKAVPYRVSIGYADQNGILKNTELQKVTGSISLNPSLLHDNLKININAKGMSTKNNFSNTGAIGDAINMDPTQSVKDGNSKSDGYFLWTNYGSNLGTPNPVYELLENDNKSTVQRFVGNVQFDYKLPFIPNLKANLNLATDYTTSTGHNNYPTTAPANLIAPYNNGKINEYDGKNYNNLLDFYLNYSKDLNSISSKIDVTAGYSWQHFKRTGNSTTHRIIDADHPATTTDPADTLKQPFATQNYLVSFFGRLNYTLMDKYLVTMTIRDDGSSRFHEGHQHGIFPSVALAWKLKNESFIKEINAISDLKLRLGWGVTGQQNITGNDYPGILQYITSAIGAYYPIGGQFIPTNRPNGYLEGVTWEHTTTKNIGLDFGFFKDRISGSFDLYDRTTDNLIENVATAAGSNYSNAIWNNIGSLENKGAELTLNLIPVSTKDMSLNIGFNLTYNKNKITKLLAHDDPSFVGILSGGNSYTGNLQVSRVGYAANSFFMNKQVYDANGNPIEGLYVDLSGKGGTVNGANADKYIDHHPSPDYLMGLSAKFSYKNFDISASSRTSLGNYVYNMVASGASYDQVWQIGYWHNEPTYLSDTKFVKRQFTSDYFVQNASFFKLDNVSLGYKWNNIISKVGARISFTVQNVWTATKYKGIDPEVDGGIDNNFYPRPRTFILGLSITY